MNNGVTIIARTLQQVSDKVTINDYQIVNGCQTSHVLFASLADSLADDVMVPMRLIATEDEEVIASIIKATNSQTAIPPLQFLAITDFQEKLENFFGAFPADRRLYYERRTRQYDAMAIERVRVITPVQLIRAYAATFLDEPIFKPARYHLMLAARILAEQNRPPKMNSNEMERYCQAIALILWDVTTADPLFSEASSIVYNVASSQGAITTGVLDRDVVRTQPFTAPVIAEATKQKT